MKPGLPKSAGHWRSQDVMRPPFLRAGGTPSPLNCRTPRSRGESDNWRRGEFNPPDRLVPTSLTGTPSAPPTTPIYPKDRLPRHRGVAGNPACAPARLSRPPPKTHFNLNTSGGGRGLASDKEECIFAMGDGLLSPSPGGKMRSDAVSRQTPPTTPACRRGGGCGMSLGCSLFYFFSEGIPG